MATPLHLPATASALSRATVTLRAYTPQSTPLYNTLPFNLTAEAAALMFAPVGIPSVPEVNTPPSVILGLKFQVRLPGSITGVMFWKSPSDSGTHYGDLWTDTNVLLTSGTNAPAAESSGGWQTILFPTPIAVVPGVNYYAVRRSPLGYYGYDSNALTSQQIKANFIIPPTAGGIRVLPGTAGSYYPGSLSTGGTDTNNYYVDAVFVPRGGAGLTYTWTQVAGPAASTITNASSPTATITAPLPGSYTYQVAISDSIVTNTKSITLNLAPYYSSTRAATAICTFATSGPSVTRSATVTSIVSQTDADTQALNAANAAASAALRCDPVQGFTGWRVVVPNLANFVAGSTSATYSLQLRLAQLTGGTPTAPRSISYLAAPIYNAANLPPNNIIDLSSYFTTSSPTTFYLWPSLTLIVNGVTTITQLPSAAVLLDYASPVGSASLTTVRFRDVETLSTNYQGYASASALTVQSPQTSAVQLTLNLANAWDTFSLNAHGWNDLVYGLKPGRGYDKLVLSVLQGPPSAPLRQTILNVSTPSYNLNDPYDFAANRISFTPYFSGAAGTATYVLRRARLTAGDALVFDPNESGIRFESSLNFYDYTTPGLTLPGAVIGPLAENDAASITPGARVAVTFTPFPANPALVAFPLPRFTLSAFKWRLGSDAYTHVIVVTISGTPANPLAVLNQYAFPLGDPTLYDGPGNLLMTLAEFDTVAPSNLAAFTPFSAVFYSAFYNALQNSYTLYPNSFPLLPNPRLVNGAPTYSIGSFSGLPGYPASANGAVTFSGTFAYGETLYHARVNGGIPFTL